MFWIVIAIVSFVVVVVLLSPLQQQKPVSRGLLGTILVIPLITLTLYLYLGRPDLVLSPHDSVTPVVSETLTTAIVQLHTHLQQNPLDAEGWSVLARSYLRIGQLQGGIQVWREALESLPHNVEILLGLGQALVFKDNGLVSTEAQRVFQTLLQHHPDHPQARFFLALLQAQNGDVDSAITQWSEILATSPTDAPWRPMIQFYLNEALAERGQTLPESVGSVPQSSPTGTMSQDSIPQDTQPTQEMIQSMIVRLEQRLQDDPQDVQGWLFLARSYFVLNESEKQKNALLQALEQKPEDIDVLIAYGDFLVQSTPLNTPLPLVLTETMTRILSVRPYHPEALWILGIDAQYHGRIQQTRNFWSKALLQFDPLSTPYQRIEQALQSLD